MLRLDKPRLAELTDPILLALRTFLPTDDGDRAADIPSQIAALAHRARLFPHEMPEIMKCIRELTDFNAAPHVKPPSGDKNILADDMPRALTESVAFRTSVASEVLRRPLDEQ